MSETWTPERIAQLTLLWESGLATAEIGRRIGATKSAVIGKAARLGLSKRQSPLKSPPLIWRPDPVPAMHLGCRFILAPDHLAALRAGENIYCCAKTLPGQAWCAAHRARVYRKPSAGALWFTANFARLTQAQNLAYTRLRRQGIAATAALKQAMAA